ncbi:MAG: uroporphyrinogen-III C-methyltransferase [Rubritalea sp.]|uniref:uroporphyrinogen-III C-methyltransferase n=1 Tax=Rubritalea sp. TaxID=2109375 RepID=UPI003241DDB6
MKSGICYLVGAGPGDIGLVTLKAKECVVNADVLVYDALIPDEFLRWAKPDCELIYVGKRASNHALAQTDTNDLLVKKALEGKVVVRLKGGDPTMFGRGGEEAGRLADAGVRFEIVPGISSAIAGPAYAGIPVTHRDYCSQLTVFTGHEDPTKGESRLDYAQLAKTGGTTVFLMGVSRLRLICNELLTHGAASDMPIALVRWATTGKQKTIEGSLSTIAEIAESQNFKAPAVAIIGKVVKEREKLNWFEGRPLHGKKVVVTRTRSQASELSKQLTGLGAEVLEIPTIKIEHPDDKQEFVEGVGQVHTYDWLVFSSPNGVERFFEAFFSVYDDARSIGGVRIAAVGPGTAKKINEYRLAVDLIPDTYIAEGLVKSFSEKENIENQTILWVRGAEARDTIHEGLSGLGAIVDDCIAYKTVPEFDDPNGAKERFEKEGADVITFVSSSAAKHFFALNMPFPEGCEVASIGPVTSATLEVIGKPATKQAKEHNIDGLVEAVVALCSEG